MPDRLLVAIWRNLPQSVLPNLMKILCTQLCCIINCYFKLKINKIKTQYQTRIKYIKRSQNKLLKEVRYVLCSTISNLSSISLFKRMYRLKKEYQNTTNSSVRHSICYIKDLVLLNSKLHAQTGVTIRDLKKLS